MAKSKENTVNMVLRILLGIVLVVFGLNGFLKFIPMGEMPEAAMAFMMASGSLIMVVKVLEIVLGVLFLANRYTTLALIALVPISVNFVLFHLFFAIGGIVPGLAVFVINVYLIAQRWNVYKPLLKA